MSNNKIYLNNLNISVTDTQLKQHFAEYGDITEINLPIDKKTTQPKGYAFISFADEASATNALKQDGETFLDKQITVQIATEKRTKK